MKAMILAAGVGSRLMPLTANTPKALVEIKGMTLLEILISKFIRSGIRDVVINVHHLADKVEAVLKDRNFFGINIAISDERNALLDTGGGIMNARKFLEGPDPFLVHNVDVISNVDLEDFGRAHKNNGSLATLAVSPRESSRYLLFDGEMRLCGWKNVLTGETRMSRHCIDPRPMAFSGIHMIDPALFSILVKTGKFSIIDLYLELAGNYRISGFIHSSDQFFDLGSLEKLEAARRHVLNNPGLVS